MASESFYYALTIAVKDSTIAAYYSITPTSNLEFSQGAATFYPTAASVTMMNDYPETLQLQAPAGSFNASVTIATDANEIAGRVLVSPPVDAATIVTLYGAGGKQIGQMIIDPGSGDKTFNFPVTAQESIKQHELPGILRALVPPATP